jgi:exodeoxyribonuclease VII large subunit
VEFTIESSKDVLAGLLKRLADPGRRLREHQQRLDELSVDLLRGFQSRLRQLSDRLTRDAGRLDALSPLAVLERGYSLVHKLPEETIIKDAASLSTGDRLRITFGHGKSICRVEEKE